MTNALLRHKLAMNITANTLTVAKPLQDVKGMLVHSSAKTGAKRIQLISKRDFIKRWLDITENKDKPKKQAARDFDAYREATLNEFNAQLATQIAGGNIRAERLTADKTGDLRTISLVRRDRRQQDTNMAHLRETSRITGIPLDTLIATAKKNAPSEIGVTEVSATSVPDTTEPTAPATSIVPEAVATPA